MAAGAEVILFLTFPGAGSFAMLSRFPIAQSGAVALAAKFVRLRKFHRLAAGQMQFVDVAERVTIETPAVSFVVLENDFLVPFLELPLGWIGGQFFMATGTGKDAGSKGRRGHGQSFAGRFLGGCGFRNGRLGRTDRRLGFRLWFCGFGFDWGRFAGFRLVFFRSRQDQDAKRKNRNDGK